MRFIQGMLVGIVITLCTATAPAEADWKWQWSQPLVSSVQSMAKAQWAQVYWLQKQVETCK